MQKIIVGSVNPVKVATVEEAFHLVFPEKSFEVTACAALSGVPDQPFGDEETQRGAYNRATACRSAYPSADYWVGLEGGLEDVSGQLWVFGWMCTIGASGLQGFGRTSSFCLPKKMRDLVLSGVELGTAADTLFQGTNLKQKNGAVGMLTNDLVTRQGFYKDAMIFSLIPFSNPELYTVI